MHEHSREAVVTEIIGEFSQTFAATRSRWSRYAEEVHPDLRVPGMMLLHTILRQGPVTATGLGSILDMDKAMVSRQVSKLRSLGLVDAKEAESDRRVILLTASATAQAAIESIHARTSAEYRARFADWTADDLAQFRSLLGRFNAQADEVRPDGPALRCAREERGGDPA